VSNHKYGKIRLVKTTIEIPDELLRKTKATAESRGETLREFITEALNARVASTSARSPVRWTKTTPGAAARNRSRYDRFSAELLTTPPSPARPCAQEPMASSHGHRSSSVSGVAAVILAMFAGGWKSSPSAYGTPSRAASRGPMVVFPVPATPMTTTTWGVRIAASLSPSTPDVELTETD